MTFTASVVVMTRVATVTLVGSGAGLFDGRPRIRTSVSVPSLSVWWMTLCGQMGMRLMALWVRLLLVIRMPPWLRNSIWNRLTVVRVTVAR